MDFLRCISDTYRLLFGDSDDDDVDDGDYDGGDGRFFRSGGDLKARLRRRDELRSDEELQPGDFVEIVSSRENPEWKGMFGRVYSIGGPDSIWVRLEGTKGKDGREIVSDSLSREDLRVIRPLWAGYIHCLSTDSLFRKWKRKYFEIWDEMVTYRDRDDALDVKLNWRVEDCRWKTASQVGELPQGSNLPAGRSLDQVSALENNNMTIYLCFSHEADMRIVFELMSYSKKHPSAATATMATISSTTTTTTAATSSSAATSAAMH